jgi:IS30 family transposase
MIIERETIYFFSISKKLKLVKSKISQLVKRNNTHINQYKVTRAKFDLEIKRTNVPLTWNHLSAHLLLAVSFDVDNPIKSWVICKYIKLDSVKIDPLIIKIFVIKQIMEWYLEFGKKLYQLFIDLKQAFDLIWRDGLRHILAH